MSPLINLFGGPASPLNMKRWNRNKANLYNFMFQAVPDKLKESMSF